MRHQSSGGAAQYYAFRRAATGVLSTECALGGHLAKAEICSGVCGFNTTVEAQKDEAGQVELTIESDCKAIQRLASELTQVDPYREFTYKGEGPLTFEVAAEHCSHAACPVPVGIIKAVEIEAGLALPADVSIKLSKSDKG
jgi:hypothetical protein